MGHGGSRGAELGRLPRRGASLSHGYEEDQREAALRGSGRHEAQGGMAQSKARPGYRTSELPTLFFSPFP